MAKQLCAPFPSGLFPADSQRPALAYAAASHLPSPRLRRSFPSFGSSPFLRSAPPPLRFQVCFLPSELWWEGIGRRVFSFFELCAVDLMFSRGRRSTPTGILLSFARLPIRINWGPLGRTLRNFSRQPFVILFWYSSSLYCSTRCRLLDLVSKFFAICFEDKF